MASEIMQGIFWAAALYGGYKIGFMDGYGRDRWKSFQEGVEHGRLQERAIRELNAMIEAKKK